MMNMAVDLAWTIYSLADSRDGVVRYVGKTSNIKRRLQDHLVEAMMSKRRSHRLNWIRSLLSDGVQPILAVLETGNGAGWQEAERKWIKTFRDAGLGLVNGTDGGDGMYNPSPETLAKISASRRGKRLSPETRAKLSAIRSTPEYRAKMSALHTGKHPSPETRIKLSVSHTGKHPSPETRQKLKMANAGKQPSPEARIKMSAAHVGKRHSPETLAKLSAAANNRSPESRESFLAAVRSPEHRARLSAAHIGKYPSPETRTRMSAAQKGNQNSLGCHPSAETRVRISSAVKSYWAAKKAPSLA